VIVGILNINKPSGWTSHDVVARVRRLAGEKRVGHAGTLDPLAEGVLPVLLGRATRLADFVQGGRKTYIARIALGTATSTDDLEGEVVETRPVPPLTDIDSALAAFRGDILQTPPAFSAVKVAGQRAYAVARRGGSLALDARPVTIYDLHVLSLEPLKLEVTCSRGTYIRSLARDLAVALGTVGHLAHLVRTRVGPFRIEDAVALEGLDVARSLLSADCALLDAPSFQATPEDLARLVNGQAVAAGGLHGDPVRVYDPEGQLVCVGRADGDLLHPRLMLSV
jgi:tRNA pseudouridine55 synthase